MKLMPKINKEQIFLGIGIAIPIIYFLNLFVLGALYPGYSHMKHWVSSLGRIEAPHHEIFNAVVILMGLLSMLAGLGFFYSVKRLSGRTILATAIGISIALFGINALFGGFFPLPDPRHGAYGIGIAILFTPILLAWTFREFPGMRVFTFFQIAMCILIALIFFIQAGLGDLVNKMNIGIAQRLYALIGSTWFIITCYWLIKSKSGSD